MSTYYLSYFESKKSLPFLYSKLLYKMGQDFFVKQYLSYDFSTQNTLVCDPGIL